MRGKPVRTEACMLELVQFISCSGKWVSLGPRNINGNTLIMLKLSIEFELCW
jgi:hypothetical protein